MFKLQLEQLQKLYNNNNNKNQFFNFQYDYEKHFSASQEFNIITEFHGLRKLLQIDGVTTKDYKQARYNILQYIINCVKHDHVNGDYSNTVNDQLIIDAGHLLYSFDGMEGSFLLIIIIYLIK